MTSSTNVFYFKIPNYSLLTIEIQAEDHETLIPTVLLVPTEQRMEESGEKAQLYTQFGCPLNTFIIFPGKLREENGLDSITL